LDGHLPSAKERLGVLEAQEHGLHAHRIHPNVLFICHRLVENGYIALIVGGAIRDLMLGRTPKDFDLVTDAKPETVRALFRNARIIGRRFRLAELRFPSMTVEVATFRSDPQVKTSGMIHRDNRFGTPQEDAFRRDFTVNALSFDPLSLALFDYVGGMHDLEARMIRTIKTPNESIQEDPVRMLRAVRFKVRLGFQMDPVLESEIRSSVRLLGDVTRNRLAEETQRFLTRGNAVVMYEEFARLGLIKPLLHMKCGPWFFAPAAQRDPLAALLPYLKRMDAWLAGGGETIGPTVAQLGLLMTLADMPIREEVLLGEGGEHRRLLALFSEWGMLNGQVEPALRVLAAARGLYAEARGAPREPRKGPPPGIREAWLLLAVLQDMVPVPEPFLTHGLNRLGTLPDLPILDHPRPQNRAPTPEGQELPRDSREFRGEGGKGPRGPRRRRRR